MSKKLMDRVIIIVGAGPGIGRATARLFVDEGASVVLVSRRQEVLDETLSLLPPKQSLGIAADVLNALDFKSVLSKTQDRFGRIDTLLHNAGTFTMSNAESLTESDWDQMINTNLKSAYVTTHHTIPYLKQAGRGSIILTSAIFGTSSILAKMSHYNASKAGLEAYAKTLAVELAPYQIRVNCVAPGQISHKPYSSQSQKNLTDTQLTRTGYPEDVALAALFLASDDASWITGISLPVDGGFSLGIHEINNTK